MSLLQSIPDFGSPGQWVPRLTLCLLQNCFAISVTLNNFLHLSLRSSRDLGSCGLTPFCLNVLKMLCSCEVLCGTSRVAGQGLPWALTVPCVLAKEHPATAIMCHSPCRATTCSPVFMQSRLLLHFSTANTNGDRSACAPACNCGGIPRAGMALQRDEKFGRCPRWTSSSSWFFPLCAVSSLFLSLAANPAGFPPGSVSLLGDSPCWWLRSPQGLSKEQGKHGQSREVLREQKSPFSTKLSQENVAGEEQSGTRPMCKGMSVPASPSQRSQPPHLAVHPGTGPSSQPLAELVNLLQQPPWLEAVSPSVRREV